MAERGIGKSLDQALGLEEPQQAAVRSVAESDHDTQASQGLQFGGKIRSAGGELFGVRQIARRQALDRIGDVEIPQFQSVISGNGLRPIRETASMQQRIHEVPRAVPGEGPTGTVGAVGAGSQPDEAEARMLIAETADRGIMVIRPQTPARRDDLGHAADQPLTSPAAFQPVQDNPVHLIATAACRQDGGAAEGVAWRCHRVSP